MLEQRWLLWHRRTGGSIVETERPPTRSDRTRAPAAHVTIPGRLQPRGEGEPLMQLPTFAAAGSAIDLGAVAAG